MKLYKVEAIVLRSREMREADRILTLLSRQRGKLELVAHGVNKPTSRKRGMVQPFCYSSFLISKGRDLDSARQCEGIEAFPGLREDLDNFFYASYIAELADAVAMEGEVNEELFALLLMVFYLISGLSAGKSNLAGRDADRLSSNRELLARAFEIRLMDIAGLRPELEKCTGCNSRLETGNVNFSAAAGGVVCDRCLALAPGAKTFSRGVLEILKLLLSWDLMKLGRVKVSVQDKKHLKGLLQDYMNYHLEKKIITAQFLEL